MLYGLGYENPNRHHTCTPETRLASEALRVTCRPLQHLSNPPAVARGAQPDRAGHRATRKGAFVYATVRFQGVAQRP